MDNFTIKAPLFQLVYQASDTTTTGSPSTISAAITSSTRSSNITDSDANKSTRLPTGAIAGIGVGAAVALFLIALLSYLLWRSQRKRKARSPEGDGPVTSMSQLAQIHESVNTPQSYVYTELPPQDGGKPQELSSAPKGPVELPASDASWTRSSSAPGPIYSPRDQQKVLGLGRRAGQ